MKKKLYTENSKTKLKTRKNGLSYAKMSRLKRKSHSIKCHYENRPHKRT